MKKLKRDLDTMAGEAARDRDAPLVEDMAVAFQASLLVRHAPAGGRRRVLRLAAERRRAGVRDAAAGPGHTDDRRARARRVARLT